MNDTLPAEPYTHRAGEPVADGNQFCTFRWHWPAGTFAPRMSAFELAQFILPHMPHVSPFLAHHPLIRAEFDAVFVLLATNPRAAVDRVLPWIRSVVREADDEWIEISLGEIGKPVPAATVYSLAGVR